MTDCAAPRHDGHDEPSRLLDAIRALHKPVREPFTALNGTPGVFIRCHGCDLGPHPLDYPDWPCSTAELVYSPEEIAEAEA